MFLVLRTSVLRRICESNENTCWKAGRTVLTKCRLRKLDESTKVLRQNAKAFQRAPSVSGIGTVGTSNCPTRYHGADSSVEKPDYSEAKIVVCMVRQAHTVDGDGLLTCLGRPASSWEVIPQQQADEIPPRGCFRARILWSAQLSCSGLNTM